MQELFFFFFFFHFQLTSFAYGRNDDTRREFNIFEIIIARNEVNLCCLTDRTRCIVYEVWPKSNEEIIDLHVVWFELNGGSDAPTPAISQVNFVNFYWPFLS